MFTKRGSSARNSEWDSEVTPIMNHRNFFQHAAVGALAAAHGPRGWPLDAAPAIAAAPRKADLKAGTQHGDSDDILKVMAAFGVNHICAVPPGRAGQDDWSVDGLSRKREHIESFGLRADALRLLHPTPIASS